MPCRMRLSCLMLACAPEEGLPHVVAVFFISKYLLQSLHQLMTNLNAF